MFMNIVSKPIVINTLFTLVLGACLSMLISFFLPHKSFSSTSKINETQESTFKLSKAFNLEQKKVAVQGVIKSQASQDFLLKDFAITGIFLDGIDSMVIVRDTKSGIFVYVHDSYKGYELVEVYLKKARFKKGVNYYWSFLDPHDEKGFTENPQGNATAIKSKVRKTVAVDMFEDIKFKDGEYFIPKDMLTNPANINRYLSSIGALLYNINGVMSFKITYIAPNSVFRKMGLKKNDSIVAMDGKPFKSMTELLAFYKNIKSAKSLSLSIKRGNQNKELKYEVY